MFVLAAYNLVFLLVTASGIWLTLVVDYTIIKILVVMLFCLLLPLWSGAIAFVLRDIISYKPFNKGNILKGIKWAIKPGLQSSVLLIFLVFSATVTFPFYASSGGYFGLLALGLSFWLYSGMSFTLMYLIPVQALLELSFKKSLKMAFVLFIDSPFWALLVAVHGLFCLALSPFLAFMIPGLSVAIIGQLEIVRLRLLRFDWLKSNKGVKSPTPWKQLLREEEELVGHRSIKELVFPWKN